MGWCRVVTSIWIKDDVWSEYLFQCLIIKCERKENACRSLNPVCDSIDLEENKNEIDHGDNINEFSRWKTSIRS